MGCEAGQAGCSRHLPEQLGKAERPVRDGVGLAVGVDVLAEQIDFPNAPVHEQADFLQNVGRRAAGFAAPGVGHHAVAAKVVAALHDVDRTQDRVFGRFRRVVPVPPQFLKGRDGEIRGEVEGQDVALAALQPGEQRREPIKLLGADHQVDRRHPRDEPLALLLGHAAAHADDGGFSAFRPHVAQLSQKAVDLLLGLVADAARVDQNQVGRLRIIRGHPAVLGEQPRHDFRIAAVHLAAEGSDVGKFAHGGQGEIAQLKGGLYGTLFSSLLPLLQTERHSGQVWTAAGKRCIVRFPGR